MIFIVSLVAVTNLFLVAMNVVAQEDRKRHEKILRALLARVPTRIPSDAEIRRKMAESERYTPDHWMTPDNEARAKVMNEILREEAILELAKEQRVSWI